MVPKDTKSTTQSSTPPASEEVVATETEGSTSPDSEEISTDAIKSSTHPAPELEDLKEGGSQSEWIDPLEDTMQISLEETEKLRRSKLGAPQSQQSTPEKKDIGEDETQPPGTSLGTAKTDKEGRAITESGWDETFDEAPTAQREIGLDRAVALAEGSGVLIRKIIVIG